MTNQGRKSCKYCRFQACLRGGMRENYVLNEVLRGVVLSLAFSKPYKPVKVQKDLLKKKPHPHRQPMKRLNSGTVIIKEEPKQRRREPIIKILLKEDEGTNKHNKL